MADSVLKALQRSAQKSGQIYPVDNRGGWSPYIREPYAGAWQNNDSWTLDCVLAYPTVYACITLIANDIAKLPPGLMRKQPNGIWISIQNTQVDALMSRPNRYQNHIQFKQWWIISKLIRGNTYVLKERASNGEISALYILHPDYVRVLVAPDGSVYYQLNQDWLNGCPETSITVPASEIIHDRMNCLFHPLVGISPLFASGLAANQGLKIQTDSARFFANGARPSGILTAPGEIAQATADRLKTYWDENFSGKNSGKVAVLGDDLKFESMRMNAVDAELIKQLDWSDVAICATYHVPGYKVNVGPAPSQSNIEALTQEYYTQCLQIHIESMELCLDQGLELPPGTGIELDLDVLFRMDGYTLVKMLAEGQKAGITSPDESRKRLNLPPVTGGNTPYLQQQNFSLAALSKRDAKEDPFATGSSGAAPAPPAEPADAPADGQGDPASGQTLAMSPAHITQLRDIIGSVERGDMTAEGAGHIISLAFPAIPAASIENVLAAAAKTAAAQHAADAGGTLIEMLPLFLREELRCET